MFTCRALSSLSLFLVVSPVFAQLPSNASLQGSYYFRFLGVDPSNKPQSFQGTLAFDGNGGFQVTGQGTSMATSSLKPLSSGDYQVMSSGVVSMLNPFDPSGKSRMQGGLGAGLLIAGSRDSIYDDLLVAIPVSTTASNATLTGTYRVSTLDFMNGDILLTRSTFSSMAADGKGSWGDVTIRGIAMNLPGDAATIQTSRGATYSLSANGSGTMNLPPDAGWSADKQLLSGNKTLYASADGNVFIAGSASTYDLVVGIKAYSGNAPNLAFQGLYFRGVLENFSNGPALGDQNILDGQGAVNEISLLKLEVGNERENAQPPDDQVWQQDMTLAADGTATNGALGAGGNIYLGGFLSRDAYLLSLRVKAPAVSGTGVFLNPQGVVNAASNAPFTAQVAPGELISLYGSGMTTQTATATSLPFPATLAGVQVAINGIPAPLYFASPTLISAVVPYTIPTDGSLLQIQVSNGSTASNVAQVFSGYSAPGIFTVPPGGVGSSAILHSDFSLVTRAKPAKVGETVLMFLTGLGPVYPPTPAGAAGPTNPFSSVAGVVEIDLDGQLAPISYAGLAPGLAGLYQVNFTIPEGVSTGNAGLQLYTGRPGTDLTQSIDAYYKMATIPIGQ